MRELEVLVVLTVFKYCMLSAELALAIIIVCIERFRASFNKKRVIPSYIERDAKRFKPVDWAVQECVELSSVKIWQFSNAFVLGYTSA